MRLRHLTQEIIDYTEGGKNNTRNHTSRRCRPLHPRTQGAQPGCLTRFPSRERHLTVALWLRPRLSPATHETPYQTRQGRPFPPQTPEAQLDSLIRLPSPRHPAPVYTTIAHHHCRTSLHAFSRLINFAWSGNVTPPFYSVGLVTNPANDAKCEGGGHR